VDQLEGPNGIVDLVALEMADHVPPHRQSSHRFLLAESFLNSILSDVSHAKRYGSLNELGLHAF
jgi:hypothetical protein